MSKYSVKLEREQRGGLEQLIRSGQASARKLMHARILLKADSGEDGPNWPDTRISEALEVSVPTIWRVRRRFVEQGVDAALNRRPQPERPTKRIFDGEKEAHLIALTCGEKPDGEGRWSVRLLADRLVKMGEVEQVSYETVRRVLKKTSSSRG
jgi:transposase